MVDEAPDAITLLKTDHREVEELFKKFEDTKTAPAKRKVAEKIATALIVHTRIENEIFYPACKGKVEEADLKEAYVEHDAANLLIAEILESGKGDEFYDAKVKVLQEEIEHHVKEEERWLTGIFSQAKRHGLDVEGLGVELQKAKTRYEAEIAEDGPEIHLAALKKTKLATA
ncbi:hemerythrin domain-containing protein [Sphingomonas astaxanthinifaciens]|uniref:Hemerythrin n=1 Tax=Sphingomonas astaxanthinifaciens DSM 22298 TaxID=1123267 RepID=A0ABQ5Z5S3_9SPHN|nr:hemerythrin domain-containing protein [Sphingomonas astaxanthinifaciens]GLR47385.1 hemerythrin [Sphingomonas astaxanthinifaciens DSM 22298]